MEEIPQTKQISWVPEHIKELKPYVPGKTIADIKALYNPPRIAKLGSNENQLGCSPKAIEAAQKSLSDIASYPDPISRELREKLSRKLGISTDQIVLGHGTNGIIQYMVKAFFGPNEQAITASGTFVGFLVAAMINNIPLRRIDLTDDYRFDLPAMADAVTDNTKMIYIANPNNPTGTYVTRTEFETFMKRIPEDILVVMDEAYFEYSRHQSDYPNALDYGYPNVIALRTFSKAYGLAGLRIGYAAGPTDIIAEMKKVKPTFAPSVPAQAAALAALDDPGFLKRSVEVVDRGRKKLYKLFNEFNIEYAESSANAVMMVFNNENQARKFNHAMLKRGVIIRPLPGFGMPNAIRVTIGDQPDMQHFEESFRQVIDIM